MKPKAQYGNLTAYRFGGRFWNFTLGAGVFIRLLLDKRLGNAFQELRSPALFSTLIKSYVNVNDQ